MQNQIILLDLNVTLVENTYVHDMPYTYYPKKETYRSWLVDLLKDRYVIMLTSRPQQYEAETMRNLMNKEGWQPQERYFNQWRLKAPDAKERMLKKFVFPHHGTPDQTAYTAIESNHATTKMYESHNIHAVTQQAVQFNPRNLNAHQEGLWLEHPQAMDF